MTRTKLMDREMPVYTKNEELFNMISHIVGGAVGVAGLVLCIINRIRRFDDPAVYDVQRLPPAQARPWQARDAGV